MATQQSYGNKTQFTARPSTGAKTTAAAPVAKAVETANGGDNGGKGKKPTHYVQNTESKEYVNTVGAWDITGGKFEVDGIYLKVSETLEPGSYRIVRRQVKD